MGTLTAYCDEVADATGIAVTCTITESSRRRLVLSQNTTSVPVNYILGAFATVTSQETMTEVAESFVDDLSDAVTTATGLTVSTELSPDATPAEPIQEDDELPPLE